MKLPRICPINNGTFSSLYGILFVFSGSDGKTAAGWLYGFGGGLGLARQQVPPSDNSLYDLTEIQKSRYIVEAGDSSLRLFFFEWGYDLNW